MRRNSSTNFSLNAKVKDMANIIQELEKARATRKLPDFNPGDTVVVQVKVKEGDRERAQAYEGVVIARKSRGLNSAFILRKISSGEGVERTFQLYSPLIASIEVKRKGDVNRAKLYYLRQLSGKAARIKERLDVRADDVLPPVEAEQPQAEAKP